MRGLRGLKQRYSRSARRAKILDEDFGLQSVLRSHYPFIKNKADVLVVWLHWMLLRNLFKGHGGEMALTEEYTEHLPRSLGWNGEKNTYLLKYEANKRLYSLGIYLRGSVAECSLVTLQRSLKVSIPIDNFIRHDFTMKAETADQFTEDMENEFIKPMIRKVDMDNVLVCPDTGEHVHVEAPEDDDYDYSEVNLTEQQLAAGMNPLEQQRRGVSEYESPRSARTLERQGPSSARTGPPAPYPFVNNGPTEMVKPGYEDRMDQQNRMDQQDRRDQLECAIDDGETEALLCIRAPPHMAKEVKKAICKS